MAAVSVEGLVKSYDGVRGGGGRRLRGRRRARCSPCSDRTAPARPRPSRSSRAFASATRAGSRCSDSTRRTGDQPAAARAHGRRAPGAGRRAVPVGPPGAHPQRRVLPAPAPGRGGARSSSGLAEKADDRVKTLSGGQQRRLDLGLGIVGNPELLFLDEPTTGFDPSARRGAWDLVRALTGGGTTVILTTHYMDEAEALADRVAVINCRSDRRRRHARSRSAAATSGESTHPLPAARRRGALADLPVAPTNATGNGASRSRPTTRSRCWRR